MFSNVVVIVCRCQALMALEDLDIVPELDDDEVLDGGLDVAAVDDETASNITGSSRRSKIMSWEARRRKAVALESDRFRIAHRRHCFWLAVGHEAL